MAFESAIGTSRSIESEFESFIAWINVVGKQKILINYDDLTMDELRLLDSIVFTCSSCGWNYSEDEHNVYRDESMCTDCFDATEETSYWTIC